MQTQDFYLETAFQTVLRMISEGFFEVDADGSIWRTKIRTRWGDKPVARRRADPVFPIGYRYVKTTINLKQIAVLAHRIVWHVLKGPIPEGLEVNHKKGDRADNRPEMLELVTSSGNKVHSYQELNHPRRGSPKFSEQTRLKVISLRNAGVSFRGIEKETCVSAAAARSICKRVNGPAIASAAPSLFAEAT